MNPKHCVYASLKQISSIKALLSLSSFSVRPTTYAAQWQLQTLESFKHDIISKENDYALNA